MIFWFLFLEDGILIHITDICFVQPDVAAPGVNILAAWTPIASSQSFDTTKNQLPLGFKFESGTSMSCPHISGIVALLKAIHPTWSPAAIKSALITTGESFISKFCVCLHHTMRQKPRYDYTSRRAIGQTLKTEDPVPLNGILLVRIRVTTLLVSHESSDPESLSSNLLPVTQNIKDMTVWRGVHSDKNFWDRTSVALNRHFMCL